MTKINNWLDVEFADNERKIDQLEKRLYKARGDREAYSGVQFDLLLLKRRQRIIERRIETAKARVKRPIIPTNSHGGGSW